MKNGNGLIPENIVRLLNYRTNQEELSSRLYYAMHEWLEFNGFFGAAQLWEKYSEEELDHAGWARNILEAYNYLPKVEALGEVPTEFKSLLDVVNKSYEHEVLITKQCYELATEAQKVGCWSVFDLALKFIREQSEELDKIQYWIDRFETMGTSPKETMLIDVEMKQKACGGICMEG